MRLNTLMAAAGLPAASQDAEVLGLTEDSRQVERGFLFFARHGTRVSGLEFAQHAVASGASAIVSEEDLPGLSVPVVRVVSMAQAQSSVAGAFYGHPSRSMRVVGVTGTNGKTTFTYLLEAMAQAAGWKTGVIGTINYRLPKEGGGTETLPAPNTTPNALELQKLLWTMKNRNTDLAVMEVSSHALALGRVDGIEFDGAVWTNLTQDHLDFHKTMEAYGAAKLKLFSGLLPEPKSGGAPSKFAIINSDDPHSKNFIDASRAAVHLYGLEPGGGYRALDVDLSPQGSRFILASPTRPPQEVRMHLLGRHNVYNALAALASADLLGLPREAALAGLGGVESIPGRLEPVKCGQNFTVLVDYAHTEDALKNVLQILRQFARGRLITVFGCGGDRDRSKRPLMGAAAVRMSDWVIVTSDNPRSEDPKAIALDIEVGIHREEKTNYEVILERDQAIQKALQSAEKDDIILLAGKGHETYQIFSDKTIHFDDREEARKALCSR